VLLDMAAALTVAADTAADWAGELQRAAPAASEMRASYHRVEAFHPPTRCTQLISRAANSPKANTRLPNHQIWIITTTYIAVSLSTIINIGSVVSLATMRLVIQCLPVASVESPRVAQGISRKNIA
jgi:hypothetical protein